MPDCLVKVAHFELRTMFSLFYYFFQISNKATLFSGPRREVEDRIVPRSVDADDADVDAQSDEDRFVIFYIFLLLSRMSLIILACFRW